MWHKIYNRRKYNPKLKKCTSGTIINALVEPNRIKFIINKYQVEPKLTSRKIASLCLRHQNGKFNFYIYHYSTKTTRIKSYHPNFAKFCDYKTFTKTHHKRCKVLINKWLKQLGYKPIRATTIENMIIQLCYPMLKGTKIERFDVHNSHLYKLPFNKFCDTIFGNHGKQTKKHVIAVLNQNPSNFNYPKWVTQSACKTFLCPEQLLKLPIDAIILDYQNNHILSKERFKINVTVLRTFLSKLSKKQMSSIINTNRSTLSDSLRIYNENPNFNIIGDIIAEIHDNLWKQIRINSNKEFEFIVPEQFVKLQELAEKENIKLVYPKTNHELHKWSDVMHNCVRSYVNSLKNQTYWIGGVYRNNQMLYNVGWQKQGNCWKIQQFYGPRNTTTPEIPLLQSKLEELYRSIYD